jgi:hypothetical protein
MAYASRSGRAKTSARDPQGFAVCQRCGIWYNRVDLNFQFDWRGSQIQNLYILVCRKCMDIPQEQLRAITLPADPVPLFYPSVEDFNAAEVDYLTVSQPVFDPVTGIQEQTTPTYRVTQNCENLTGQPVGHPDGLTQNAVMPLQGTTHYGVQLPVLSVYSVGNIVYVTCSAVHNLQTGYQVSVEGLSGGGNGFFTVNVTTATAFNYQTMGNVSPQLQPTTRMITANVGLPRGYTELPL